MWTTVPKTNFSLLEQPDNPSPHPFHQSGDSYGIKGSSRPPCTKSLDITWHKVDIYIYIPRYSQYVMLMIVDVTNQYKSVNSATQIFKSCFSRWLRGWWRVCWDFLPRLWIKIATWQDRTVRFFSCSWHWKVWFGTVLLLSLRHAILTSSCHKRISKSVKKSQKHLTGQKWTVHHAKSNRTASGKCYLLTFTLDSPH